MITWAAAHAVRNGMLGGSAGKSVRCSRQTLTRAHESERDLLVEREQRAVRSEHVSDNKQREGEPFHDEQQVVNNRAGKLDRRVYIVANFFASAVNADDVSNSALELLNDWRV